MKNLSNFIKFLWTKKLNLAYIERIDNPLLSYGDISHKTKFLEVLFDGNGNSILYLISSKIHSHPINSVLS